MSLEQVYESVETKYGTEKFEQIRGNEHARRTAPQGRRRGKSPQSFNGMHRRRRKKVSW
ncbi:hypothetical protein [Aeoliella sp. SH292]|uniref:hypothetical protein n=1 Tax=Aeoliella sp. SH292 TaxID=3454464 RepID=UPI003F965D1E